MKEIRADTVMLQAIDLYILGFVYYYLTMRKDTANFLASAEYDLNTAEHMLKTGRYIYVIFMCHLSIYRKDAEGYFF